MLIESDNRLDALVEVVEAVVLVGRVDGVFAEAEAHQDGFDAEHFLEPRDNRDGAARAHWDGQFAVGVHIGGFGGLVSRQVDGTAVGLSAMQRRDLHRDVIGSVLLKIVLHQSGNLLVVLVGHQAARQFGVGLRRQHGLGAFARVAAPRKAFTPRLFL